MASGLSQALDKTICVWNAMTGETVAGPFTGHTGSVNSVAFSPDGQQIVSGSDDQTIHMWNMNSSSRDMVVGHMPLVSSVGFPSDCQQIISSKDKPIYMLDSVTKSLITITQVNFTDQSVIDDDGWICGNKGELLMWIPPLHRTGLHRPSTIWVVGKHETRLDLSKFVHGRSWMRCFDS
jgi:WD40 repeat protein